MIREAIVKLVNKENLTYEMAEGAMDEIMGGKADPIQISAFLTAITMKGETIEEITACANGMQPTVSKRSASKSTWSRRKTKKFWKNLESVSCSHRNTTCP